MSNRSFARHWTGFSLVVATAFAIGMPGCSKQAGPTRYTIRGTVTFRGEPVPIGTIAFEPDASLGNRGPAGYADIISGRFQTHLGAVGGPHVVRINGASGPMIDETQDTTLFINYTTTCNLPHQSTMLNFDVTVPSTLRQRKPPQR